MTESFLANLMPQIKVSNKHADSEPKTAENTRI